MLPFKKNKLLFKNKMLLFENKMFLIQILIEPKKSGFYRRN